MRNILVAALLCIVASETNTAWAQGEPVKPYLFFVFDVSGSMDWDMCDDQDINNCNPGNPCTGPGEVCINNTCECPDSCTGGISRLDNAKCAYSRIVNGFGEMVMGLGKFRQTVSGSPPNCGNSVRPCDASQGTTTGNLGDSLDVVVPILEDNDTELLKWVDFTVDTCTSDNSLDPEFFGTGNTPLGGSLAGARLYWQGANDPSGNPYWTGPGDDPIRDDPFKNVFVSGAQCRPYITILMTDGDETCGGDAETRAAELLVTDVDGTDYRIETKPIGFGVTPGDADLEAIAHAGGEPDGPGDEAFYAQNEDELAAAISQIIADNLKFEQCNNIDDDCDLLIDEDFPGKGLACDDGLFGICKGTGSFQCTGDGTSLECVIDTPGQASDTEICNGLDDDCDNKIDEGNICQGCDPVEQCDNLDNDCDGSIDENLMRDCGSDVGECELGSQTCTAGNWSMCDDVGPTAESCNGLDDDCDGVIDGFSQACTDIMGNNPGVGQCQAGQQVCPSDGSGMFGTCLGEIGPTMEACDTLDNDCDATVDEDTGGANCDTACGTGTTECMNGMIICNATQMPMTETCNNTDDDCDGAVDEGVPDNGPCDPNGDLCVPGTLRCVGGTFQCIGGVPPDPEICDCIDNDCDMAVDENVTCGAGETCTQCQCASPCGGGEFPCPVGERCVSNYCVIDPCFGVNCTPDSNGDLTECVEGTCERVCDAVTCGAGAVCFGPTGICVLDNCSNFPDKCTDDQLCVDGVCEMNPCTGVTCPDDQYCQDGACASSCAPVTCPEGERCAFGTCEPDPCGGCEPPAVCNEASGECGANPCGPVSCPVGQACDDQSGTCVNDPCDEVVCPNPEEICSGGSCYSEDQINQTRYEYIAPGGGGGCDSGMAMPALLFALLLVFGVLRRDSREEEA